VPLPPRSFARPRYCETLLAAKGGDANSMELLAQMLQEGYGCPQDVAQARLAAAWHPRAGQVWPANSPPAAPLTRGLRPRRRASGTARRTAAARGGWRAFMMRCRERMEEGCERTAPHAQRTHARTHA
jgi:hypothetical protein